MSGERTVKARTFFLLMDDGRVATRLAAALVEQGIPFEQGRTPNHGTHLFRVNRRHEKALMLAGDLAQQEVNALDGRPN